MVDVHSSVAWVPHLLVPAISEQILEPNFHTVRSSLQSVAVIDWLVRAAYLRTLRKPSDKADKTDKMEQKVDKPATDTHTADPGRSTQEFEPGVIHEIATQRSVTERWANPYPIEISVKTFENI